MGAYYVVLRGHQPGVYMTWQECQANITGFRNPVYKSFRGRDEAQEFFNKSRASTSVGVATTSLAPPATNRAAIYVAGQAEPCGNGQTIDGIAAGAGIKILLPNGKQVTAHGRVPANITNVKDAGIDFWTNTAELYAIYAALSLIRELVVNTTTTNAGTKAMGATIYLNSSYALSVLNIYAQSWSSAEWSTVANGELIEAILQFGKDREIRFEHCNSVSSIEEVLRLAARGLHQEESMVVDRVIVFGSAG